MGSGKKKEKGTSYLSYPVRWQIIALSILCLLHHNDISLCRSFETNSYLSRRKQRHRHCVCVLHIALFFLPVDIHHTQCPCRFLLLKRYKLCGHNTTTHKYYIIVIQ